MQFDQRGDAFWLRALSRQRVNWPAANSKGVSGERLDQILARFDTDILPLNPGVCSIEGGTNDVAAGAALATMQGRLTAIIAKCLNHRIVALVEVISPRDDVTGGLTAGQVAVLKSYRDWQRTLHAPRRGIYVSDHFNDLASSPDSATAAAGMLKSDGVHPTAKASYWRGKRKSDLINLMFGAAEPWDIAGASLNTNSAMTGTSGTKTGGITGNVATSWGASVATLTGDQAIAAAKVTLGGREWQQFTITGTWASAASVSINQTLANFGVDFVIGDTLSQAFDYEIDTPVGLKAISADILYKAGTVVADATQASSDASTDQTHTGIARIQRFTLPSDATRVTPQFEISWLAGTVNIVIRVSHPHLIKG